MKKQSIDHTRLLLLRLLAGEDMYGYQLLVELARRHGRLRLVHRNVGGRRAGDSGHSLGHARRRS